MYSGLKYDLAAIEIVNADTDGEGAVMFKGWLGPIARVSVSAGSTPDPQVRDGKVRFFTHPQFLDWLEIDAADILYQTNAAADDPEGGSVIWIKRKAPIRRCQAGEACWFEHLMAETAHDPTVPQGWRPNAAESAHRKGSYP